MIKETSFSSCVVDKNGSVYATCSNAETFLYRYDSVGKQWKGIGNCDVGSFGLGMINNKLVRIGGRNLRDGSVTGIVMWFDEAKQDWDDSEMPESLPTPRYYPAVAYSDQYVAVCGGSKNDDLKNLNCVEILKVDDLKWYEVQNLPFSGHRMSAIIDCNYLYVANSYGTYSSQSLEIKESFIQRVEIKSLLNEERREAAVFINPSSLSQQESVDRPLKNVPRESKWLSIGFERDGGQGKICPVLFGCNSCILSMSGSSLYAFVKDRNEFMKVVDLCKHRVNGDCTLPLYGSAIGFLPDYKIMVIGGENKDGGSSN